MLFERSRLTLSLAGWRAPLPVDLRSKIDWAVSHGFMRVTLDAAAPECRARDLGRSARRDLAALLRRSSLAFAGLDLWLPEGHLDDPAHTDRALAALMGACDLAADLAELAGPAQGHGAVVNTVLSQKGGATTAALRDHASARGVLVADHQWPRPDGATELPVGVGLDPARILISEGPGADPGAAASRLGASVVSARLSDADGSGRCAVGTGRGRLDVLGYVVGLSTAGYQGPLVVDVRGLEAQESAIRSARAAVTGGAVKGGRGEGGRGAAGFRMIWPE